MIPKIIHQIWLGHKFVRPEQEMQTWQTLNPEWEYKLWHENNLPEIQCHNLFESYMQQKIYHGASDILRNELLNIWGGFYADADSIAISPIPDKILIDDCFASYANEIINPNLIANGFMGAIPNCRLMRLLIHEILQMKTISAEPWQQIGPQLLTRTIANHNYPIKIYPSGMFIGTHWSGRKAKNCSNPISTHFWGTTLNSYQHKNKWHKKWRIF
jgi:mannosyltransferase OCH1-like enzyme